MLMGNFMVVVRELAFKRRLDRAFFLVTFLANVGFFTTLALAAFAMLELISLYLLRGLRPCLDHGLLLGNTPGSGWLLGGYCGDEELWILEFTEQFLCAEVRIPTSVRFWLGKHT